MKRVFQEFITDAGRNFLRKHYEKNTKDLLLKYMKNGGELCAAGGFVNDVITGKTVRIEDGGYRDNQFEWSDQDIYHVEKYDAAVTDEFLEHVLQKMAIPMLNIAVFCFAVAVAGIAANQLLQGAKMK